MVLMQAFVVYDPSLRQAMRKMSDEIAAWIDGLGEEYELGGVDHSHTKASAWENDSVSAFAWARMQAADESKRKEPRVSDQLDDFGS